MLLDSLLASNEQPAGRPRSTSRRKIGSNRHTGMQQHEANRRLTLTNSRRLSAARTVAALASLVLFASVAASAQQLDPGAVIRGIDAAVLARVNSIAGYTVTEHYAVYRGADLTHDVADMVVKTTYRKESGKSYSVVSESGSALIRKFGLDTILENERQINLPGNVEHSWITSANYAMTLKPGGIQHLYGRDCLVVSITPKAKAPNLIVGTIWVDAKDYTIVRLEGIASRAPSIFAGATHMMRQYASVDGFSMATHARAESTTFLYGKIVVTIDYSDYTIQLRAPDAVRAASPAASQ
jgi:outer membrane lipoprotein-sorting protein